MNISKVGLHAPLTLVWNFGANAGIDSAPVPVDDYYHIVEARASWTALGTDGGAVTLTIEKLTGTQAPAGGANMFGATTINLKGTINTVNTLKTSQVSAPTVAQTAASRLSPGDRISATLGGTLTSLKGLCVLVVLKRSRPAVNSAR